jgi:hypothetical protein
MGIEHLRGVLMQIIELMEVQQDVNNALVSSDLKETRLWSVPQGRRNKSL